MRLICPNCGAQYEVEDGVIPEDGRDVQCSSCGHAWFQMPPHPAEGEEHGATESPREPDAADDTSGLAAQGDVAVPGVPFGAASESAMAQEPPDEGETGAAEAEGPAQLAPRRKTDESVLSVLREEAEREARARRAERSRLETQPDLGLSGQASRRQQLAEDAPPPEPAETEAAEQWPPPSPRKRLPDIEEINSTLGPGGAQSAEDPGDSAAASAAAQNARRRRGFRIGFFLVFMCVLALLGLYAFAPQIVALIPDAEPALTDYVRMVDDWRLALDARLDSAIRALTAAMSDGDV